MDDRRFGAEVTEVPEEVRRAAQRRPQRPGRRDARRRLRTGRRRSARAGSAWTSGGVGYINSTGIALVVRLLADARRDGRTVRAIGLTEHYREIFRITRLSDFMEIVEGDAA